MMHVWVIYRDRSGQNCHKTQSGNHTNNYVCCFHFMFLSLL